MDSIDIKTKMLFMAPVAFGIILLGFTTGIEFENLLSNAEQHMLDFTYTQMSILDKQDNVPVDVLEGPLYPDPLDRPNKVSGKSVAAPRADDLVVSMITISGDSKMAIIQGVLVKEGDLIDDNRVVKIEPKRVLLKNKENKWIYMKN